MIEDKNEKRNFILIYIGNHYLEFQRQSKLKLKANRKLLNFNIDLDHNELLSDVIFSVVNKFDDDLKLDRFYKMAKENQLSLYIFKSIDINCHSFKAPYLQSKIHKKRIAFYRQDMSKIGNLIEDDKPQDSDTRKLNTMTNKQQELIKQVYELMKPESAERLFGPHWKYFVRIFHDYMDNPKGTYKNIALKYDVPLSSIRNHLQLIYKKIRDEINKN